MKLQLVASLVVVAAVMLLLSVRRAPGAGRGDLLKRKGWTRVRLTAGADNRASTSKTVVLGWTAVVAWVVIATVLLSGGNKDTFAGLMEGLSTSYFAVLGGPVLAAFLAKAVTDSRTAGDGASLQKTESAEPAMGDLVSNDDGGLSVADAQYVILNLCAAAYVVYAFAKYPDLGVPGFPEQLALLTGGSAATYAGTKSWTANAPRISAMTPTRIKRDNPNVKLSIRGVNLVSPGRTIRTTDPDAPVTSSAEATRVLIDGWPVKDDRVTARGDEVIVTALPEDLNAQPGTTYKVTVVTAAGLKATSPDDLEVV